MCERVTLEKLPTVSLVNPKVLFCEATVQYIMSQPADHCSRKVMFD